MVLTQGWEHCIFSAARLENFIINVAWLEYSEGPCVSSGENFSLN